MKPDHPLVNPCEDVKTPHVFLPYQLRWLNDMSPVKIWEKSRRIGATYAQSYEDVSDVLRGASDAVWFSSADESAAREYISYCRLWAGLFSCASGEDELVLSAAAAQHRHILRFANGGRIIALSSNPKSFRSKGGKVVLDEFAHHADDRALWKAAKPAVTWGFPLRVLSTHNGKLSLFYNFLQSVREGDLNWSAHRTDIFTAVNEGLTDRILGKTTRAEERDAWLEEIRMNCFEETVWQEEFCCLPVDAATAFLPLDQIRACIDPLLLCAEEPAEITARFPGAGLFLGVDIGRRVDATVFYVLALVQKKLVSAALIVFKNQPFASQSEMLHRLLALPRMRKCCIDATGMGAGIAEEAAKRFGSLIEQVTISRAVKEELAFTVKRKIEACEVVLPDDPALISDLHSIRRRFGGRGSETLEADRGKTDGHGDRFWALALALRAAKNSEYMPVLPVSRYVPPKRDARMPFRMGNRQ